MSYRSLRISLLSLLGVAALGASALAQAQAVPRAAFAFPMTVTVRVTIESVDVPTRSLVATLPDGNYLNISVADNVRELASLVEDEQATITYHEVVTVLNLKRKGEGARAARRVTANPTGVNEASARFTYTVHSVDQVAKTVSLIPPGGGAVRTVKATTPTTEEALRTMKTGDVLIGFVTPLQVTAIAK